MTAPEHSAGVDTWELGRFIGRRVWDRPEGCADTTPCQWVELLDVWLEPFVSSPHSDWLIATFITWDGRPHRSTHLVTGLQDVELTAEEAKTVKITDLGGGYESRFYDPWADGPTRALAKYDTPRPEPIPDIVPTPSGDQFILHL